MENIFFLKLKIQSKSLLEIQISQQTQIGWDRKSTYIRKFAYKEFHDRSIFFIYKVCL